VAELTISRSVPFGLPCVGVPEGEHLAGPARQRGDRGQNGAPVLASQRRRLGRPYGRLVLHPAQPGPSSGPQHRPGSVDDGGAQIRQRLGLVPQTGHGTQQPDKGILHHVLGALLVTDQQQGQPDQADGMGHE
jgi:hypothetical protein